jgi:hypothetical protein
MGLRTFKVDDQTGPVAAARVVTEGAGQEVFIISAKAQVVRINLQDVKVTNGRYTKGVIVWRDREPDDFVASVACFTENDYSTGGSSSADAAAAQAESPSMNGSSSGSSQSDAFPDEDADMDSATEETDGNEELETEEE